jgi:hypothetical protein
MMFRLNSSVWMMGFVFAAVAQGAPTAEQFRNATLEYIVDGQQKEGIDKITGYLSQQLGKSGRVSSRELGQLATAAECVRFMQRTRKAKIDPETAAWLLASGARLHVLMDVLEPEDRPPECMRIIETLLRHDPQGCGEFFDLMLAIAVVLDQPGNEKMHGQMGRDLLPVNTDPVKTYDYFKGIYSSGLAKIEYGKLGATELVFVVAPAPMSEVEWARDNVKGSLSGWDEKYSDIEYDHARLKGSRFSWDAGTYTLQDIQQRGGICVDQAYYAVLTARAHGIPAIYFHGSGKNANHAWFAYMKGRGDWVLDVGRYQGDDFTTGYAINPQTLRQMTDHDVEYTQERSTHSAASQEAGAYVSIAEVLLQRDPENALRCARLARDLSKKALRSWEIELAILLQREDCDGLLRLFDEKKDAFRKYPDILVDSAKQIEKALRKAGRNDDADRLVRNLAGAVDDDRDDLVRSFENQRIKQIMESGDMKKARKEMEQLLDDQKDQGNKIFGMVHAYVKLTKDSGQTREAVKFLEDYVEDLVENYNFPPRYEEGLLQLLLTVYENDGDTRDAEEIKLRISRLKAEQNT